MQAVRARWRIAETYSMSKVWRRRLFIIYHVASAGIGICTSAPCVDSPPLPTFMRGKFHLSYFLYFFFFTEYATKKLCSYAVTQQCFVFLFFFMALVSETINQNDRLYMVSL